MGSLTMNIGHKLGGKLQMDNGTTSFVLLTDISDNGHIGLTLRNDPYVVESLFGRFNRRWDPNHPLVLFFIFSLVELTHFLYNMMKTYKSERRWSSQRKHGD
jgi:hypothetical protein